ncbi:MAG: CotH kinase family protein [Opitutaceae bacterium]|nr:CotH kinase family protein [Verrucomicrobiales bacterium]
MNKQQMCDSFYHMDNVVTINIIMPQASWNALRNAQPHGGLCVFSFTGDRYDWFNATSVEVSGTAFPAGGTHIFHSVGIKKRSFCGSFSTGKPALALNFSKFNAANENVIENLIGTKYITLNNSIQDPSFIRQTLGFELFRQAGLPHSRCNYAHVKVNGVSIGFYVNIEPIKSRHIEHNFNNNDAGNIYEIEFGEDFTQPIMNADRISFEGLSNFADKKDLKLATQTLASTGVAGLDSVIDVPQFVRFFAMETLLKHWDGYAGNLNNTYIYNDVTAVANPGTANVNFKFIPWGLDQILQQNRKFILSPGSVLGGLVLNDGNLLIRLNTEIRSYANSIFDRDNYNNVLLPFIAKMEQILVAAGEANVPPHIAVVRAQLKLVKSGGFQLIGEFPLDSCHLLDKATDECAHASHIEPVGEHYESYHRVPAGAQSDRWYVVRSHARPAYKIVDRQYGTYLHASATKFTNAGHLNVYCYRFHPHDGNYFTIELVDSPDPRTVTGYFKIKSARTGNYLHYSATDLTPLGRKRIYQSAAAPTILYLF